MDWKGALKARLVAAAPVTALVGTSPARVDWVERPQASALPAITLQTIDDARPRTYGNFQEGRPSTVQMDVWAASFAQKEALTEAAITALAGASTANGISFQPAYIDSVRDLGERVETQFIHRTSIDLIVWHSPA